MDSLMKKMSAYDLINILMPGGVLTYFLGILGYIELEAASILYLVPIAFALGVIGSRVGSLLIEPLALKLKLVERDYASYVKAQAADERLSYLTAVSNMYRTFAGSIVVLAALALGALVPHGFKPFLAIVYGVVALLLFFWSWVKQEGYLARRVKLSGKDVDVNC